jgi:hypothetical protein
MKNITRKAIEALIAAAAIAGVVLMYFVYPESVQRSQFLRAHVDYFFFFTILSNILVFALFAGRFFFEKGKNGKFFSSPIVNGAVTVYITVTGLIFFFFLRTTFKTTGINFDIANALLHNVVPAAVFLYWLVFVRPVKVKPVYILYWLSFPLLYLLVTLLRGAVSHWYPYPFLDVLKYGYPQVLLVSAALTVFFTAIGSALFGLSRIELKKEKKKSKKSKTRS